MLFLFYVIQKVLDNIKLSLVEWFGYHMGCPRYSFTILSWSWYPFMYFFYLSFSVHFFYLYFIMLKLWIRGNMFTLFLNTDYRERRLTKHACHYLEELKISEEANVFNYWIKTFDFGCGSWTKMYWVCRKHLFYSLLHDWKISSELFQLGTFSLKKCIPIHRIKLALMSEFFFIFF